MSRERSQAAKRSLTPRTSVTLRLRRLVPHSTHVQ